MKRMKRPAADFARKFLFRGLRLCALMLLLLLFSLFGYTPGSFSALESYVAEYVKHALLCALIPAYTALVLTFCEKENEKR